MKIDLTYVELELWYDAAKEIANTENDMYNTEVASYYFEIVGALGEMIDIINESLFSPVKLTYNVPDEVAYRIMKTIHIIQMENHDAI